MNPLKAHFGRGYPMPEMEKRRRATEATLARYRDREFDWAKGATCAHMVRFHLRAMGVSVPATPRFRSEIGAMRVLKKKGWGNCSGMLDAIVDRHPSPAFMRLGDVCVARSESPLQAMMIAAAPNKVFGWREDAAGLVLLDVELDELEGAWNAWPR